MNNPTVSNRYEVHLSELSSDRLQFFCDLFYDSVNTGIHHHMLFNQYSLSPLIQYPQHWTGTKLSNSNYIDPLRQIFVTAPIPLYTAKRVQFHTYCKSGLATIYAAP